MPTAAGQRNKDQVSVMMTVLPAELRAPVRFYGRTEVIRAPCAAPAKSGIYAWYFSRLPDGINADDCHAVDGRVLLYAGISPSAPPANGRAPSRSHLRQRLRTHFSGNAAGSTLRLTLGCLLSRELGIQLRRVGSTGRYTFTNPGEQRLDSWMQENAAVVWFEDERPWIREAQILASGLHLPLNISGNLHASAAALSAVRRAARAAADLLPIVTDSGGARRSVS